MSDYPAALLDRLIAERDAARADAEQGWALVRRLTLNTARVPGCTCATCDALDALTGREAR